MEKQNSRMRTTDNLIMTPWSRWIPCTDCLGLSGGFPSIEPAWCEDVILWSSSFAAGPFSASGHRQLVSRAPVHNTAVCIMIDRVQKWVKCNFPSPLIGIHGQPHWQLEVSGFPWFQSTGKVRLPKCGNCPVPCTFTLVHYGIWDHSLKDNLQPVKRNLWGTL